MCRTRTGRAALLVSSLLLASAGCGGTDTGADATTVAGIPVLEGVTSGPGTRLGAGFHVVEGSVLVGPPLPVSQEVPDSGFTALLLVTGPFQEVFDAYRRQAADLGIRLRPSQNVEAAPSLCWQEPGPGAFTCDGSGNVTSDVVGPTVGLTAYRRAKHGRRPPLSHLVLDYHDAGPGETGAPIPDRGRPRLPDDPPLPSRWPALPGSGEPYEADVVQAPLRVPRGAELVAPPIVDPGQYLDGSSALFRADGDPAEVVDDLVQRGAEVHRRNTFRARASDNAELQWDWGGGTYAATATRRGDGPTWLLVVHGTTD
jgi:hypothetical protein